MGRLIAMAAGTLAIAATQLLVGLALVGIGLTVRRLLVRRTALGSRDVLLAFWVGFATLTALLITWHFFLPITGLTTTVILAAGLAGVLWHRRPLAGIPASEPWLRSRWVALVLAAAWLWIADLGRAPLLNTDGGLYHLQGVMWAKRFPVVPGLTNLFGPLGFNNSSLLYDAFLDVGPWTGGAHHLANGLLLQMLVGFGLTGLIRAWHARGRVRIQSLYEGMLLVPAANAVLHDWLTGFVTDLAMSAMVILAVAQAHLLLLDDDDQSPDEARYRLVTVALFSASAVTFKLSGSVLAASLLATVGLWWLVRRRTVGPVAVAALVAALIGGQWMTRGVLLSGYPLFPTTVAGFPVDWKAPEVHARAEYAFAAHSARSSTENVPVVLGDAGFEAWFPEWLAVSGFDDLYALMIPLSLIGAIGLVVVARRVGGRKGQPHPPWVLLVPIALAGGAWFLMAPEPRYVLGVVWSGVALVWAGGLRAGGIEHDPSLLRSNLAFAAVLGASPLFVAPWLDPHTRYRDLPYWRRLIQTNVVVSDRWIQPNPKTGVTSPDTTATGLVVMVPRQWCWGVEPPCTPNPSPTVYLRRPGSLAHGFRVKGRWAMKNWPAPNRWLFGETWRKADRRQHPQDH